MVLVDYRGFRLLAMTVLPIRGNETLVYGILTRANNFPSYFYLHLGTGDAGANIYNKDKVVYKKMKTLGQKLNLKPHKVNVKLPPMENSPICNI